MQVLHAPGSLNPRVREFDEFRQQIQKRSLTPEEFEQYQRLGEQMQNGILHRDIKPANILLELPSIRPSLSTSILPANSPPPVGRYAEILGSRSGTARLAT